MPLRDEVKDLLRGIQAADEKIVKEAVLTARLLLEQSHLHVSAQRALADEELLEGLPADYAQRRPQQIHDEFQPLLPPKYLDLILTDEEIDAITDALLRLLDGPRSILVGAVAALARSTRLYAVPRLTDTVRCYATTDGGLASQAIFAIGNVIRSIDPRYPLMPTQEQTIAEAYAAMRFSVAAGIEGLWNVRQAADRELSLISAHFGRSF